jgi:hypothetical protein
MDLLAPEVSSESASSIGNAADTKHVWAKEITNFAEFGVAPRIEDNAPENVDVSDNRARDSRLGGRARLAVLRRPGKHRADQKC